jgi:hypothetical protein
MLDHQEPRVGVEALWFELTGGGAELLRTLCCWFVVSFSLRIVLLRWIAGAVVLVEMGSIAVEEAVLGSGAIAST